MPEANAETSHVLLVIPSGTEARGMAEALGELPATLETADNIFLAVSRFTARPADVVVLGLAHIDDRDLQRAIPLFREIRPGVFLLLAFPPRRRDSAVKALALGADGYILEPFYLRELTELVRRGLVRSRLEVETSPGSEEEQLEKLAGAIGHAVRNPLQIIELLLSQEEVEADEIRQEMQRIELVAEELLAFARRTEIQKVPVDLNEVVKETVPLTGNRRRRFRRKLDQELPSVAGDAKRLALAFSALAGMANARGKEGRLEVTTAKEGGDGVRVAFRAPDLLLSREERAVFFRPFSGPVQGEVGLSAAAAEGIILSHRGEITLESREGEGTTVTLRFPASGAPAALDREKGARAKGE